MKIKQILVITGIAFQVVILSVTLYFLHEVNQKGDPAFDEGESEMISASAPSHEKGMKVPFQHYITGSGKVACSNYVKVNAKREGIIEKLSVKEGDVVKVGDPLLQIDGGMLSFALKEKIAEYEAALTVSNNLEVKKLEIGMKATEKALSDCNVTAPFEGRILKVNVNPGEYTDPSETALIIGAESPLHLRVLIDEKEMWRVSPTKNLRAIALHKTNPSIHFVLDFLNVRPALNASDKTDGKLEMLFAFDKGKAPLYLDQTLDVYIEAASPQDTSYLDYQFNQK